jgi:hypothetical protein
MSQPHHKPDPGAKGRPYLEEADIGSGEKTPAQLETERMIREIPPLPAGSEQSGQPGAAQEGSAGASPDQRQPVKP